jgi:two-component system, response regulator PdtaR
VFSNFSIAAPSDYSGTGAPRGWSVRRMSSSGDLARRLVFVEDDYLTALNSIDALKGEGYEVVAVVQSGQDAIRAVQDELPDLLVMDVRLSGGLDGVDAAIEIFQRFGIRSVFATAHTDDRTRARASLAHPLGWVAKPYSDTQLVRALNTAVAQLD